jgi:RES domain-containing protein
MKIWRLVKDKYAHNALNGEGARITGGRWNLPGTSMVYTSGTLSLALLELLVHFDHTALPKGYVYIIIEIPTQIRIPKFKSDQKKIDMQEFGTKWVDKSTSLILEVPSMVVPIENNYLLNPNHPDFKKLNISKPKPFLMDPRLIKK